VGSWRHRIVVAVVVAALGACGGGDDGAPQSHPANGAKGADDPGTPTSGPPAAESGGSHAVPHLVPESLPPGLARHVLEEYPAPPGHQLDMPVITVSGNSTTADPLGAADWAIITTKRQPSGLRGEHPVTVHGLQGEGGTSSWGNVVGIRSVRHGFNWIGWREHGYHVVFASWTLSEEALANLVDLIVVDTQGARFGDMPADLAYRWKQIGTLDNVVASGAWGFPSHWDGHDDLYDRPGDRPEGLGPSVSVVTYPDPVGDDMVVHRWLAHTAPTRVRGDAHAVLVDDPRGDRIPAGEFPRTETVIWQEAPGIVAFVNTVDFTRDEALQLVEDLQPASPS